MKIKFNHFERMAGLFVLVAAGLSVALTALTAIKKGWFDSKVQFYTEVITADGLRDGTPVTISGLRAGQVTDVELISANTIMVHFEVSEKFRRQIRRDSRVSVIRPFILGDKALEIIVGSENEPLIEPRQPIPSQESFDMMDLVSGKKLGPFLGTLEGLMANLSRLAEAFADPKRTEAFVKMFDRMDPLILNLGKMAQEVTKLSAELNAILPEVRKESPAIGRELSQLVGNLGKLTAALEPAVREVGPELPQASRRALQALDEVVVTLKALQKSFLLSGNVKEVRQEEAKDSKREPSGK